MKLVIDANEFFAAFIKKSKSREILNHSFFEFFAPVEFLEEIEKYKEFLIEKTRIQPGEFTHIQQDLMKNIHLVSLSKYNDEFLQARDIMKDIDVKDAPFIAIALALDLDGIWADDKHFSRQAKVNIYSTKDLIELVEKTLDGKKDS